jgi:hypothetical protein
MSSTDPVPRQPGVVRVQVVGCTRPDSSTGEQCLTFTGLGAASEGRAVITALLSLTGGPSSLPQAALTARKRVQVGGLGFSAYNTLPSGSGVTVHSGESISGYDKLESQPGSPGGDRSIIESDSDLNLSDISGTNAITGVDRMFAAVFNMRPVTLRQQQAAVELACGSSGCSAAEVRTAASRHPWRPIWVEGDLVVDTSGDIGSKDEPVLLVVAGDLQFSGPGDGVNIYGMVYVRKGSGSSSWSTSGAGTITGSTLCDARVEGDGASSYVYNPAINNLVRWNTGSYVRVPGSWRDYQ